MKAKLTPQERELLELLADGKRAHEVCRATGHTPQTLASKLTEIRNRYGCANTTSLIAVALRKKLIA